MNRFRRVVGLFVGLIVTLAIVGPSAADMHSERQLMFPPANTAEARLVRVQIGPHIFDIPRNARDIERDRTGKLDAMSMQVLFPTMEGLAPEVGRRMVFLGQEAKDLQVLLSDRGPELSPVLYITRGLLIALSGEHGNMTHIGPLPDHIETASKYGLTQFLVKQGREGDARHSFPLRDKSFVFADLRDSDPVTYIECSGEKKVPNPHCSMEFAYRSIHVKLHFAQALLPDWRAIRDGFSRYLDERCVNC